MFLELPSHISLTSSFIHQNSEHRQPGAISQIMIKRSDAFSFSFLRTASLASGIALAIFLLRQFFCVDIVDETIAGDILFPSSGSNPQSSVVFLNTTLCTDKCFGECESYLTPLEKCYNGHKLFPPFQTEDARRGLKNRSNPYGKYDIFDEVIKSSDENVVAIKRSFFESTDSSCENSTGSFEKIPLQICVGPFGEPLPWGSLKIASIETLGSEEKAKII
eukprot:498113_1